ncbi:MAG: hypothetical protein LBV43_09460 [Prevotella sp.]|nr:hypothetical protein [Prevotella sp.]
MDTFILGLCVILIPLQALSLFLPSNQYTLASFIAISFIYWIFAKDRYKKNITKLKDILASLSSFQKTVILVFVAALIVNSLIPYSFYDADYYHFQNIKWNEQYAAVSGLANLEDRFGFNSNYLLLSSIFTFSFLFSEVYVLLQSLLFCLIFVWALARLFQSQYDIKYIIILSLMGILYFLCSLTFKTSDTDIIPTLCIFYFFIKVVLDPDSIVKNLLFPVVLLISLITYKFSTAFFSIVCLYIIIHLIKEKMYRKIIFISTACFLILLLWCTRNAIISGYLVYPIYYIDIFSFDWKVPKAILILQKVHITEWAYAVLRKTLASMATRGGINLMLCFTTLIMLLVLIIKKKKLNKNLLIVGGCSVFSILLSLINAPDFRFVNGFILGNMLILCVIIFEDKKSYFIKSGKYIAATFVLCIFAITMVTNELKGDASLLLKPQGASTAYSGVTEYPLGSVTILITDDPHYRTFYTLPCSTLEECLPFRANTGDKLQDLRTIEARGESLQDGFRTKKEYVDILNQDVDKYLSDYYKHKYNIVR